MTNLGTLLRSESGLFSIRSMAWPDSTGCVQEASTSRAPALFRASATLVRVPAVSTMSSTIRVVRPSTSPMTPCARARRSAAHFDRMIAHDSRLKRKRMIRTSLATGPLCAMRLTISPPGTRIAIREQTP